MSSTSDYQDSESSRDSSQERCTVPPTNQDVKEEKSDTDEVYNDAYRLLFNADVARAAARFEMDSESQHTQYGTKHVGTSRWSVREQNVFYAALGRLGRDDVAGIAGAIGTKSIPETQELLLLLQDAAIPEDEAALTLRDIPAAFDVGSQCNEQLDLAAEALAWYEETCEANQEKDKYGDYWRITPQVAGHIESAIDTARSRATTSPLASEPETSRRGGRVAVGYVEADSASELDIC